MNKFIKSIKIFSVLTAITILASCSGLTQQNKQAADGKVYLSFSVNDARSVYNPDDLKEDDIDAVRLYCKRYKDYKREDGSWDKNHDINNYDQLYNDLLQEWLFERQGDKNAIQVFEDAVLAFNAGPDYYHFRIELCVNELSETGKNEKRKDGGDVNADNYKYYTPIQYATKEKVLVVPGLNNLSFETKRYKTYDWMKYHSILEFEYTADVTQTGYGYMEAELRSWPYADQKYLAAWDNKTRKEVDDSYHIHTWESGAPVDGKITMAGFDYIEDGYYRMYVTLYDTKGGNILKEFKDVINLNGYKTKIKKEIKLTDFTSTQIDYGTITIDDPWDLCVNNGKITITDTVPLVSGAPARTYSAELKYGNESVKTWAATNADPTLSWTTDLFAGKTAVNGAYACQLTINEQTFDVVIPDRKYYSYSVTSGDTNYLDYDAPGELASATGNIFIHFTGVGENQDEHEETDPDNGKTYWVHNLKTIGNYARTLLMNMSENANVFIDLSAVTGVDTVVWGDIELADSGAWLTGIAFPDSVKYMSNSSFLCPKKKDNSADDRIYEITVVLGSQVENAFNLFDGGDVWQYGEEASEVRNLYNPFKKFIVSKDNPWMKVYLNGAILAKDGGGEFIEALASADVIENLEMPYTINKINSNTFAGNKKLKHISGWGITEEICNCAFYGSGVEGDVTLGNRIRLIGERAFERTNVTSLTLSNSVEIILTEIVPKTAYIGYPPDSNTKSYWEWIDQTSYDEAKAAYSSAHNGDDSWDVVGAFYQDDRGFELPDSNGSFMFTAWKESNKYKYKDYIGITGFNECYCWRVEE